MQQNLIGQVIRDYKFIKQIGEGKYGTVFLAKQQQSPEFVAIKVIELQIFQKNWKLGELAQAEINGLKKVHSIHVVRYINTFNDKVNHYLVMEYCDSGDLWTYLKEEKNIINERDAIGIIKQVLQGLKDMHANLIIHRDLKMANILIHNKSVYKIADLGFCKLLANENDKTRLFLGSPGTMAPEIQNGDKYGLLSDLFSVGAILYYILFRQYPFEIGYKKQLTFPANGKFKVSEVVKDLLRKMLEIHPKNRITFIELSTHEAFKSQNISTISRIQILSNQIDLTQNKQFYIEQSSNLECIEDDQTTSTSSLSSQCFSIIDYENQQPRQRQSNRPDIINLSVNDSQFEELWGKKDRINKIISSNNSKINQVYYFSNALVEIVRTQLQIYHIFALLCCNISNMINDIVKSISEQVQSYKSDKDLKDDVQDLEAQKKQLESLQVGIKAQITDIEDQLKKQFDKNEKQCKQDLCKAIYEYVSKPVEITYCLFHIIQCGKYCLGIPSDIDIQNIENIQVESYFDLQNCHKVIENSAAVRSECLQQFKNL